PGATGGLDLGGLADLLAEHGGAERRRRRHGATSADRAHLDRDRLAVSSDLDDRADADDVGAGVLDDHRALEPCAQRANARLEESLLVLRGVVLEVLRQVAELARRLDRRDHFLTTRAFEMCELGAQ